MSDPVVRNDANRYVVVGFDGRWQEVGFLRLAAREAAGRRWPLLVVTLLRHAGTMDRGPRTPTDTLTSAASARESLARAAAVLRLEFPTLSVRAFTMDERDLSPERYPLEHAGLVIVGATGTSGLRAGGPGPLARRLVEAATCPVQLVPSGAPAVVDLGPDALTG